MEFPEIESEAAQDEGLLSVLCRIDEEFPCVGRYFRSGPHRRQTVGAALAPFIRARGEDDQRIALARVGGEDPSSNDAVLLAAAGRAISQGRGNELIRRAYGECPSGFLGALKRCGSIAYGHRFYVDLHRVFQDKEHRAIYRALKHEPVIHPRLLRTALKVPSYLCKAGFLAALCNSNLEEFLAAIELIREVCPAATTEAMASSITLGAGTSIQNWVSNWIGRAILPDSPFSDDSVLVPVRTIAEMESLGREMRNCLKSKSVIALTGAASFLVARIEGNPYVVELLKSDEAWAIGGIYGVRNSIVPTDVSTALKERLRARAISPKFPCKDRHDRWEPIRRALRHASLADDDNYDPGWIE